MNIKRLFVGPLHTNCYLLDGEGGMCVIDPGGDAEKILSKIAESSLEKIVLTHGHFDHMMAAKALHQATGAKVYISEKDAPLLKDSALSLYEDMHLSEPFPALEADAFFEESITLCGVNFEVIETPGHTEGSVSLYGDGELFSGDTLFCGSIGRHAEKNSDIMMRSLWKLMLLDDDVRVHPGHGFSTTIGQERAENPFLR